MTRTFTYFSIFVCFLIPGYLSAQSSHLQLSPIRLPGQFPGAGIRMKDYVYSLQNDMEIPVNLNITGDYHDLKMHQAVRQNLFLIFKETVNNAIKYDTPIHIQLPVEG